MRVVLVTILLAACAADTSQARLRTAVDARKSQLADCYAKALEHDTSMTGKMVLVLHVPQNVDEVDSVDVERGRVRDRHLQRCVKEVLVGANIGDAPTDDLNVEYTLAFKQD